MSKTYATFVFRPSLIALAAAACAVASAQTQTMSEVVVSASGFEQDIKEAPASITVITRQQLEEKRVSNLAQALEDVEGVDVGAGTDKTGGPNISIRGMGADYTLILIDGRRQNAAGNVTPMISAVRKPALFLRSRRLSALKSFAAPCPRCTVQTPWAA